MRKRDEDERNKYEIEILDKIFFKREPLNQTDYAWFCEMLSFGCSSEVVNWFIEKSICPKD